MTCRFQIKVIISKRSGDYHYLIRSNHQNANARARREKPNAAEEKERKKDEGLVLACDIGFRLRKPVGCELSDHSLLAGSMEWLLDR
jgi:hypothetical protein